MSYKIGVVYKEEQPLASLNQPTNGGVIYRIEEIPLDELDLGDDEMLVPVAHYQKDCFTGTFGTPFFVKVKNVSKNHSKFTVACCRISKKKKKNVSG